MNVLAMGALRHKRVGWPTGGVRSIGGRMRKRSAVIVSLALALVGIGMSRTARADDAGDAVIQQVDDAQNRYKTLMLRYKMTTKESGRSDRVLEVQTYFRKGKQFTELLAPADVRGTKVLHVSDTQMYVYLPAFRKVRRIASHVSEQGFMGTTYSQRDMHLTRWAPYFTGTVVEEDDDQWKLQLEARPDSEAPYGKMRATISKKYRLPTKIQFFNAEGTHVKTEIRSRYVCEQDVCVPRRQMMKDHTKGGKISKLVLKARKVNPKLSKKMFSKRNLRP